MTAKPDNKPIRILLVEDDEDDYLLTRELLAEAGGKKFKLDWAKNFKSGLDAIKTCGHDAYLLDYRLGAKNGVQLVSEAIAAGCKNPLILLTGAGDREIAMQALAAGAADYLVKGEFDAHGLERTLRYSIQKSRYAEDLENEVRRRTETLRHSEEFNRSLMQGSTDCLKVLDIDGRLLMMNEPGMCIMEIDDFGDIDGCDWASLWPAESENKITTAVKLARKGEVNSFEAFCPTAKGTPKWWGVTVSPIRAKPGGPVVRLLSVSRDITERRAEDLRLALFARLGEIARTADDPEALLFALSSAVCENLEANRCFFNEIDLDNDRETVHRDSFRSGMQSIAGTRKLSKYSPDTLAEMRVGRTVVNNDSKADPRTAKFFKKMYAPIGGRSYIKVPLMRGGRWVASFWVSDDKPREWSDEEVRLVESVGERAWLAVEKLRNEAALRESEERFSRFMHHLPGLAWIKDIDGRYVFANEAAAAAFRTPPERLYGKTDDEVFPPDIAARFKENDERAVADGTGLQTVEALEQEDGVHHSLVTKFPITGQDGQISLVGGMAIDITERQRMEEELRRYRDELEDLVVERTSQLETTNNILKAENKQRLKVEKEAVRLLKQIVTIQEDERRRIARDLHDDLGQKLTALRLKLENAKDICSEEAVCIVIDEIQVIARRLDADVGFLAWELRPAALDDMGLAAALETYVREWSRFSSVNAGLHVSGLEKGRLPAEIEINLYRIVQEALNNANKYAQASTVSVMLKRQKYDVLLIIEDNGVGFDTKKIPKGKSGLGLTGMRERSALLGGTIHIESSPASGTTIFVRVPIDTKANAEG